MGGAILPMGGAGMPGTMSPPSPLGGPGPAPGPMLDHGTQFSVGDLVQICTDMERMKILQRGQSCNKESSKIYGEGFVMDLL